MLNFRFFNLYSHIRKSQGLYNPLRPPHNWSLLLWSNTTTRAASWRKYLFWLTVEGYTQSIMAGMSECQELAILVPLCSQTGNQVVDISTQNTSSLLGSLGSHSTDSANPPRPVTLLTSHLGNPLWVYPDACLIGESRAGSLTTSPQGLWLILHWST